MNSPSGFRLTMTLILVLFLSCGRQSDNQPDQASKPSPTSEWTVMVYVNGDNNLERAAVEDFLEMAKVGSNNQVNVIAQMDLIGVYYNIGWSQTLRFRVTQGMQPTTAAAAMDIGEANMGDPTVLKDFVNWSMTNYPAKKYALVIWDHGQGYRLYITNAKLNADANAIIAKLNKPAMNEINHNLTDSTNNQEVIHIMEGDPFRSSSNNSFKSCSNDETSNDELFNREIQDGLAQVLAGKKLDLLGFDACLMGMVETGYAMRQVAHYFVGSEELEPGSGWQYDDWLKELEANSSMEGKSLAKLLVNSYARVYGDFTAQTLSAVELAGYEDATKKISKLAGTLQAKLVAEIQNIKLARDDCFVYAPNPYQEMPPKDYFFHVDFIQFCERLAQRTKDSQIKAEAAEAKNAMLAKIFANYRGNLRAGNFGSNGLAIYFPQSNTQYRSDLFEKGGYKKGNRFFPVEFVDNEKWADFLHAYFKMVP